jgi:uncharacterized protein (TIGR00369 family)
MDESTAADILRSAPFHQFLDVTFDEYEEGHVVVTCPFREELLVNAEHDVIHGGILASLLDIAGHYSVLSTVGDRVPTADFRIDYLRPARRGELTAEAEVVRVGSNLAVTDVELRQEHEGEDKTMAIGRGSYGVSHVEG